MGQGAFVQIVNTPSNQAICSIGNENCMYDGGDEGSWVSKLNTTIPGNSTFPNDNSRLYIEAKASGSCAFETSSFNLTINGVSLSITEKNFNYTINGQTGDFQIDNISISLQNAPSGSQASLTITVNS